MEYKLKTKEVEPKIYAILFQHKEIEVIKLILAFAFEDAVATGRKWIAENLKIPAGEIANFVPVLYEGVKADSLIDLIVQGDEKVVTDTNVIMQKIKSMPDRTKARKVLKENIHLLSPASVEYMKDEIKKLPVKKKDK